MKYFFEILAVVLIVLLIVNWFINEVRYNNFGVSKDENVNPDISDDESYSNYDRHVRDHVQNDDADLMVLDGYDHAILGVVRTEDGIPHIVYSRFEIISTLVKEGMSAEEAEEHFSFNIEGTKIKDGTPLFLEN